MDIATVRNALVTTLKGDADLTAEIGASLIDYGLGRKITVDMLPLCIRVKQLGRGDTFEDAEAEDEVGAGKVWVWCLYRFHVVVIFAEKDGETAKQVEDRESTYDRLLRKALSKRDLGGVVVDVELGRTSLLSHPEKDSIHMVLLEIHAKTHEQQDVR